MNNTSLKTRHQKSNIIQNSSQSTAQAVSACKSSTRDALFIRRPCSARRASILVLLPERRKRRTSASPTRVWVRRSFSDIPIFDNDLQPNASSTVEQHPSGGDEPVQQEDGLPNEHCEENRVSNEHLWYAIEKGVLKDVRKALETSDPNFKFQHDWTALHLAASMPGVSVKCAELLIEHKANVEARTKTVYTPFALACERGKLEMVKALISLKGNTDDETETGESLCHLATANDHRNVVKYLLRSFPSCEHKRNHVGQRPVEVAHTLEMQHIFNREGRALSHDYSRTIIGDVLIHNSRRDIVHKLLLQQQKSCTRVKTIPLISRLIDATRAAKPFVKLKKRIPNHTIGPDTFIVKSTLGKGAFGEVYHVIHRGSHESYAMKVIKKSKMIERHLLQYAMTERNVLSFIEHPFIVPLHFAFQTPQHLVLVLEFCPSGSLEQLISREKTLPLPLARLYTAEFLLALEHLHKRNIIYRDLKPDNVVLDIKGHALLTDFGLTKEGVDNIYAARSFCGSAAYLSPEMLLDSGHGHTVDLYGLGVLLFEMLTGKCPYYSHNREQMFQNIRQAKLQMPNEYKGTLALSLIEQLMDRNPARRLGVVKTSDVRRHAFFRHIDWAVILKKNFTPLPSMRARLTRSYHLWQIPEDLYMHDMSPLIREAAALRDQQTSSKHYVIEGWEFVRKH